MTCFGRFSLFLSVTLIVSAPLAFASDGYKCKVLSAVGLQDDGALGTDGVPRGFVGQEFVVDKGTGRIIGTLTNHGSGGQPQVVDYGSDAQAYKAITVYQPNVSVDYLYVQEFNETEKKPFFFVEGSKVLTGHCLPF